MNNKEIYERAQLCVVKFRAKDIITTSGGVGEDGTITLPGDDFIF